MPDSRDWTFESEHLARTFGEHVREQLPWYDLVSQAVAFIARNYVPVGGLVYDIGASTDNLERLLAPGLPSELPKELLEALAWLWDALRARGYAL